MTDSVFFFFYEISKNLQSVPVKARQDRTDTNQSFAWQSADVHLSGGVHSSNFAEITLSDISQGAPCTFSKRTQDALGNYISELFTTISKTPRWNFLRINKIYFYFPVVESRRSKLLVWHLMGAVDGGSHAERQTQGWTWLTTANFSQELPCKDKPPMTEVPPAMLACQTP